MVFSERLKHLRKSRNFTQKQIAETIKITERGMRRLESGENPNYNTLIALADFFDVSLDYLVGRSDNPNKHE